MNSAAAALPQTLTTLPVEGLLLAPLAIVLVVVVLLISPFTGAGST